jgi:hypothetical protein
MFMRELLCIAGAQHHIGVGPVLGIEVADRQRSARSPSCTSG